jgi:large subunit ribosomal protein L21
MWVARFCNRTNQALEKAFKACLGFGESKKCGGVFMYAVVETGGKQYRLSVGDVLKVEKLPVEVGEKYVLDKVLLIKDDNDSVKVGTPVVENAKVTVTAMEQGRGKKIIVYKYKRRKNERKKQGHRQAFTRIKVETIEG